MLDKKAMHLIQELKLRGYTQSQIPAYFKERGLKVPSRPTIHKYYEMDSLPDNPGKKLEKSKAFNVEPFKSTIISILEANDPKKICISSVYDVLEETYIETGEYDSLPGNEQTLRNYVHYLENSGQIDRKEKQGRIYEYVSDTPPGQQMLLDFGKYAINAPETKYIYFICLLLRYSRYLCVFAQDHPYTANEACSAIYKSFCNLNGRPEQLVLDQDPLFIVDETAGEVTLTQALGSFCTEQELKLWVCNKHDPESKGPIENSVGFVKKSFFSARNIGSIQDVWRSLPGWLERQNSRIHRTTYRVPVDVFKESEQKALRPLIPSMYEESPSSFKRFSVKGVPYLNYRSNRYSLPRKYAYQDILYKAVGHKLYIYDTDGHFICEHTLAEVSGQTIQLPEHKKPEPEDWIPVRDRLERKWHCGCFQHFINGVKKENPRHVAEQLQRIEQYLDAQKDDREFVARVLEECCAKFRYQFKQFKVVYEFMKEEEEAKQAKKAKTDTSSAQVPTDTVDYADMSLYTMAFNERTEEGERRQTV